MNMYNDLANTVINYSLFLGCKVTTFFNRLYQLPMENIQTKENRKPLQISWLRKTTYFALWKIISQGMERESKLALELKAQRILNPLRTRIVQFLVDQRVYRYQFFLRRPVAARA